MDGYDHEGIRMLFNQGNDTDEIERVVGQLVQKKLNHRLNNSYIMWYTMIKEWRCSL